MGGKKLAIIQSNYIPWKGYFDLMNMADEFILYDHAQYTKEDWRNRNKIKTAQGLTWLTIPILVKGRAEQRICDAEVNDTETDWARKHWGTISQSYARAPFFKQYRDQFDALYTACAKEKKLSQINFRFIELIRDILGIKTRMTWSMDYEMRGDRVERLIDLCQQLKCNEYLSGPSAKSYIDARLFEKADIKLSFVDFLDYPEYPQLYPPFEHHVSVIDLIFNVGPEAARYLLSGKK